MGTISRSTKQGGTTSLQDGQLAPAADVETDIAAVFTEFNGEIDDANIKTAEMPGAKSFRFTEISNPSTPAANDVLVYAKAVAGATKPTTVLAYRDDAGSVMPMGNFVVLATSLGETTTATGGAVDLVSLTPSPSIPADWWWGVSGLVRKTAGAAAASSLGLKVNGSQIFNNFAVTSAANQAEFGVFSTNWEAMFFFGARATNYTQGAGMVARTAASGASMANYNTLTYAAQLPTADITAVVITGNSGNASITLGVRNVTLWAMIPFTV